MSTAANSKAQDLATALGGVLIPNHGDNRVSTADGLIYTGCTGKVRLQRAGHPIVDLGRASDDVTTLAAAYQAALKGASA